MHEPRFEWIGGHPALDFTNTVAWSGSVLVNERLATYADLVAWAEEAGLVRPAEGERLMELARQRPLDADHVRCEAHALRDALHAVFVARAEQRPAPPEKAATFQHHLARALSRLRLDLGPDRAGWTFAPADDALDAMLSPVAWQAARLLASDEARLIRACGSETCGWLFVDRSRNHSRRWCDMAVCGNNAKARRHYARRKARA